MKGMTVLKRCRAAEGDMARIRLRIGGGAVIIGIFDGFVQEIEHSITQHHYNLTAF